jgi:hypothetical protein
MVISMLKPNWILQVCLKCFYSDPLHRTLECKGTKFCPLSFWVHHNVSTLKDRANQNNSSRFFCTHGAKMVYVRFAQKNQSELHLYPRGTPQKQRGWLTKPSLSCRTDEQKCNRPYKYDRKTWMKFGFCYCPRSGWVGFAFLDSSRTWTFIMKLVKTKKT